MNAQPNFFFLVIFHAPKLIVFVGPSGITTLGVVAPSVIDVKKDANNLVACGAAHVMLPSCADLTLLLAE